jgi:hypothetical protein
LVDYEDLHAALDEARTWWPLAFGGDAEGINWDEALAKACDLSNERSAATALGELLLPRSLIEVAQGLRGPARAELVVNPSRGLASVPWELLVLPDDGRRLIDIFDVRSAVPATVIGAPRHAQGSLHGAPMYVVDPVTGLPAVLTVAACEAWETRTATLDWQPQSYVDRELLRTSLAACRPSRLTFFGHCVPASEDASATGIMLSDHGGVPGSTKPIAGGRSLAAHDLLTDGSHQPTRQGQDLSWTFPPRVALIACGSGLDQTFLEPLGLVAALIESGADVVVASRWVLPSDLVTHGATTALGLAVDACLMDGWPTRALNAWKREKLLEWTTEPRLSNCPALWSSMVSYEVPSSF